MCLSVCLSVIISCVQNISENYEQILLKFSGEVGRGRGGIGLDCGGNPDSFVDRGSFSSILYH